MDLCDQPLQPRTYAKCLILGFFFLTLSLNGENYDSECLLVGFWTFWIHDSENSFRLKCTGISSWHFEIPKINLIVLDAISSFEKYCASGSYKSSENFILSSIFFSSAYAFHLRNIFVSFLYCFLKHFYIFAINYRSNTCWLEYGILLIKRLLKYVKF